MAHCIITMAKATLSYKLPEEAREHMLAVKSGYLASTLWDISQELRNLIKYSEDENLLPGLEAAQKIVLEKMEENDTFNIILNQ